MGVAGIGPTFLGISPGKAHFFQLANPFKSTTTNYSNCFNRVCTTSRFALQFWIGTMLSSARLQYLVSSSLRQFDQCLIHVYILYYIYTVYYIVIYCIYCIYIYTVQSHKLDLWNTQHQRTTHLLKGLAKIASGHLEWIVDVFLHNFAGLTETPRALAGTKGLMNFGSSTFYRLYRLYHTHILLYSFLCLFGLCVTKLHHYKIKSTTSLMKKTAGVKLARLSFSASAEPIGSRGSDHFKHI